MEYIDLKETLNSLEIDDKDIIMKDMLKSIIENSALNKDRLSLFNKFINTLNSDSSLTQKNLILLQSILKLVNDFKRENSLDDLGKEDVSFVSKHDIDWLEISKPLKDMRDFLEDNMGRKIINNVRNLSQRVSHLYGKIDSLHHLTEINKIDSYSEKKKYVDNLYKD